MPAKKNKQYIFKGTPDTFVMLDPNLLKDGVLTGNEILVMLVLLSFKDTWRVRKSNIQQILKWSKVKLNTAWSGLQEKGFITKEGSDRNTEWIIHQNPNLE